MTPTESQTYFLKRGHLQAFSEALHHAILDRDLEMEREQKKKTPVTYYYDADVLIWLVLGFQNEPSGGFATNDKVRLVHALLSAGYLGAVHVLRPHALEFHSVVRRQPVFRTSARANGFNARVRRYVRNRGVNSAIQGMLTRLRSERNPERRLEILLACFRDSGAETFATFALANGGWQQRLRSMSRTILRFDWPETDDLHDSLTNDDVWTFYHAIAPRRTSPDLRSVNNLADAASMAALARMVRNQERPVRFFTTTRSLRELVLDEKAAQMLICPFTHDTILRSAEYYIVRACFEALRFPPPKGVKAPTHDTPSFGLTELRIVRDQLARALAATAADDGDEADDHLMQFIEEIQVGGEGLPDVLARIEQAAFLDRIFFNYPPPERLRNVVAEIDAAWEALARGRHEITSRLREEIQGGAEEIQRTLANELHELEVTLKLVRRIVDEAVTLGREDNHARLPDPMSDLGMVRWALDPGERGSAVIAEFMSSVLGEDYNDPERLIRACAEIAEHAMMPEDAELCAAVCCILWTLNLFDEVEETITRFESAREDAGEPMKPGFHIMRQAARVRARAISSSQAETMMVRLREYVNAAGADRGRVQIGLGYVLFFLWEREKRRLNRTDDEALRRWAQESFECGVEAARLLPDDDLLGVAFAVNHQVFVGMETEFCSDDQLTELRRKLLDHLDTKKVWNYRFADTVAMLRYRAARGVQEQLRNTELPVERKELREQACLALEHAAGLLRRSRPYYGDREVFKHINRIHDLQIDIGCP